MGNQGWSSEWESVELLRCMAMASGKGELSEESRI